MNILNVMHDWFRRQNPRKRFLAGKAKLHRNFQYALITADKFLRRFGQPPFANVIGSRFAYDAMKNAVKVVRGISRLFSQCRQIQIGVEMLIDVAQGLLDRISQGFVLIQVHPPSR
jgi:hypothetical protein